ncbi:MAG: hypothetical protein RI894_299 [Bacteroidota bacterium]|jgi:hypothetical protein
MENLTEKNQDLAGTEERELRRIAKKRVGFKNHAFAYLLVNTMVWAFWLFSGEGHFSQGAPWGMTFFWGIGLAIHGTSVYFRPSFISEEREYENLRKERGL